MTSHKRVVVGVVEDLSDRLRIDHDRRQRGEREQVVRDANPSGALEHHVQLGLPAVAVPRGGLARTQSPEPRAELARLELLGDVGVQHTHLVGRAPEGVGGGEDAEAHARSL